MAILNNVSTPCVLVWQQISQNCFHVAMVEMMRKGLKEELHILDMKEKRILILFLGSTTDTEGNLS